MTVSPIYSGGPIGHLLRFALVAFNTLQVWAQKEARADVTTVLVLMFDFRPDTLLTALDSMLDNPQSWDDTAL